MLTNNQIHIFSNNKQMLSSGAMPLSRPHANSNKQMINLDTMQMHYNSTKSSQQQSTATTTTTTSNPMQIQNYITWINSHLKKRPGVRLVENLETDISNGVCLVHLIEVISGTVLTDVNLNPRTMNDNKENIEKILRFMQQNSVKMHQTSPKEILEGNIKSIMRLILALAAHFKPTNVQPYSTVMAKINQTHSPSSSTTSSISSSSSSQNNQKNLVINKRSYSTNSMHTQYQNPSNNYVNSTYVIDSNLHKTDCSQQKPVVNLTRNLDSMTHLVQAACVSLADVRRFKNENFNVKYVKRNNLGSPNINKPFSNQTYAVNNNETNNYFSNHTIASPNSCQPIASSTILLPNKPNGSSSPRNLTFVLNKTCSFEPTSELKIKEEPESSSIEKEKAENQPDVNTPTKNSQFLLDNDKSPVEKATDCEEKEEKEPKNENVTNTKPEKTLPNNDFLNNLHSQFNQNQADTLNDVQSLKEVLLNLQNMLLNEEQDVDRKNDLAEDEFVSSSLTPQDQIKILRSKIQEMETLSASLRNELNQIKSEKIHKTGINSGLKSRIDEQDNTILELKDEQLNLHLINQQLSKEREDLSLKLNERMLQINQLKQEINKRDDYIDKLKVEISTLICEKEKAQSVRQQVKKMTDTLDYVQEKENELSNMIAKTDKKLVNIDSKLALSNQNNQKEETTTNMSKCYQILDKDEAMRLKESLTKLRQTFDNTNHPSQYLVNQLEQSFLTIIDRLVTNNGEKMNGEMLTTSTTGTPISSNSPSIASSSANSPVLQTIQSQLSLSSSINSSSSSTSSSSSSLSAIPIVLSNKQSQSAQQTNDQDHIELPIINNESNVKKIISRLLSQNSVANTNSDQKQLLNNKVVSQSAKSSTNSTNTLLTISSTVMQPSSNKSDNSKLIQSQSNTKCIYYLNNNMSSPPFLTTIPRNIESVTLNDFKQCLKLKNGTSYIYHFKTSDPEFGIVKEEISNDNKLLPSFENRIVAWIQEIQ